MRPVISPALQYYNAYFPGGAISMPPPLNDGQVDYPDGTPNSASQLAKDVSTFLTWAADPTQDERKLMGTKAVSGMILATLLTFWYKRFKWNVVKTRKFYWADEVARAAQAGAQGAQAGTHATAATELAKLKALEAAKHAAK